MSGVQRHAVAIIGSFRRANYAGVQGLVDLFEEAGFRVLSPSGATIVSGEEFVRFRTDDPLHSDAEVQSITLERIFKADCVFVLAPNGYVGRTTCYEIGRVIQRRQPIYFSEMPTDLPVHIPPTFILSPSEFVIKFGNAESQFSWLYTEGENEALSIERRITDSSFA